MTQKVLLVDDNTALRTLLGILLGTTCKVLEAPDGEQGLKIMTAEHPQVVVLDVSLPKMDGIEVLHAAKAIDAEMHIIMLTAKDDVALAKKALESGADMFITKPFEAAYLRREIERLTSASNRNGDDAVHRPWRIAPESEVSCDEIIH